MVYLILKCCRAKHYLGIDFGHPMLLFHLQLDFFLNKKVRCSQRQDISASCFNDSTTCSKLFSVYPPLRDPSAVIVYVAQSKLLMALKMTILGTSSIFHTWDSSSERFVQAGVEEGKHGLLMIDGKDEVVSRRCAFCNYNDKTFCRPCSSIVTRFLTIGTLLRRLEIFVAMLRTRCV
jgi:hypothetical protein